MTVDFDSVLSAPRSGRDRAVIIDHHEYAQSVFLRGQPVPWTDPVAYANFIGQAQGLLNPDVTLLDLGRFYSSRLTANNALREAMSTRTRIGYALKTLLADPGTAKQASELASVLAQTSKAPLVLQIPEPTVWLASTHEGSGAGSAEDIDVDDAENMSIYVADWLRGLAALPVSALLLDTRWTGSVLPDVPLPTYSPMLNVTDHYRWPWVNAAPPPSRF
ncbi:hypothetical protein SIM91_42995 [Rhodococcus opacus]|uniref:hypothetical protein n=1 Tax=Rhodococcus opacus TaxID=37919 RepID=UPI000A758BD3|nr:hypothetical protein [Rhodococcus opacus]MDX5969941.1 hypothetical protein [Rhodococcus opacus]CAG7631926.1 hypothetical protein E143388_07349 [Rhodococcus opacus]